MQDTTTVPTKGQTITIQEQPWWNRSCRRRGCDGTASTRVPSDGRCIYLSRGDSPCDHPYTKADWKRARKAWTPRPTVCVYCGDGASPAPETRQETTP